MTGSTYVSVHALAAGYFTLPERFFVAPLDDESSSKTVPSLSFLIVHTDPENGDITRLVFDLGVRRVLKDYPKAIYDHVSTRSPISGQPDVVESLTAGGLMPGQIDGVIFSHLHWDHIGTPSDFQSAAYIVGPGTVRLMNDNSTAGSHNHFEPGVLDPSRIIELAPTKTVTITPAIPSDGPGQSLRPHLRALAEQLSKAWVKKGPFEHTIDVFGDASVYIVSSPGHIDGHINLLCRTGASSHVYLAGDALHDVRLLTGEKKIATWLDSSMSVCCMHSDRDQAEKTIDSIREAVESPGELGKVEVVFAHDADWEAEARGRKRFFPGAL